MLMAFFRACLMVWLCLTWTWRQDQENYYILYLCHTYIHVCMHLGHVMSYLSMTYSLPLPPSLSPSHPHPLPPSLPPSPSLPLPPSLPPSPSLPPTLPLNMCTHFEYATGDVICIVSKDFNKKINWKRILHHYIIEPNSRLTIVL